MKVNEKLKEKIASKGITLSFIANKMPRMSIDLLSKKLKGNVRLTADELVEICDIINIKIDDLRPAS